MDQSSQNLLSDREKGERLKEIFETLNKMKKRLERLKATRTLSPAEMKEYAEVSVKLGSFHEKCKNFIKTRKNGPGKFMIEEYLKWCSSQKSAQHRNSNQYRSSLEYIKGTYGQERGMHAADPDVSKAYSQPFSPGQPPESSHQRSAYFREVQSPYQLNVSQRPFEQVPLHGHSTGAKQLDRMQSLGRSRAEGPFCSSFSSSMRNGSDPSGLLRASLGNIEPLQCQREPSPQNIQTQVSGVYHYTSPPSGYSTRVPSAIPQPITIAARRSSHLDPKNQKPSILDSRPGMVGERVIVSPGCNSQNACHGKSHQLDSVHSYTSMKTAPSMLGGFSQRTESMIPNPKYSNAAGNSFSTGAMSPADAYALSPDDGCTQSHARSSGFPRPAHFTAQFVHPHYRSLHVSNTHFMPQSPPQFSHSAGQPLQYDQSYDILSRSADSRFETKAWKTPSPRNLPESSMRVGFPLKFQGASLASSPRNVHSVEASFASTARANAPPHDFPFEFRFDNRASSSARARASSPGGSALKDEESVTAGTRSPGAIKEAEKKSASMSLGYKIAPKHDLLGVKRVLFDDFIREIDPKLRLSSETKDSILIHLDSVMHRATMISATVASTRPGRTICVDDICLGLCKAVKPEFGSCFEGQKQIEDCRDYSLHNRILEIIESQEQ